MAVRVGNKYGAKRCEEDGFSFDSLAERAEYRRLKLRLRAGEIADLKIHPRFGIVVNRTKICSYIADFSFTDVGTGQLVIEDVKSPASITAVYKLKKRLMFACLGLEITEVMV